MNISTSDPPVDRRLLQQQIQRWRRTARCSSRADRSFQAQDSADIIDSLRMKLRQANDEIALRDRETRRLRSAVTHLEGALSLRERELRDTVLCLHGDSPARPHQEWLQEGTSSSRLRLQVHRLQRAVAARQDHIEHLNRQASLGFLREAREQAEEFRTEAKRLARALAEVTGGVGGSRPRSSGFTVSHPFPSATAGTSGDAGPAFGKQAERPPTTAADVAACSGRYPQAASPAPRVSSISAEDGFSGVGVPGVFQPNSCTRSSAGGGATGFNGAEGRPWRPSLAWEQTLGAAIQASAGGGGGETARRVGTPHDARSAARISGIFESVGDELAMVPPWTTTAGAHGYSPCAKKTSSPRRRKGKGPGRGSGWVLRRAFSQRGCSPDGLSRFTGKKRSSCMAAAARLRSSLRQSAAERNEAMALSEEARRLQTIRAARARRMRSARQKIARYREKRIHELESRFIRQSGAIVPHASVTAGTTSSEKESRDEASSPANDDDKRVALEGQDNASVGVGPTYSNDNKLQQRSRRRREIDAAIDAAAMGEEVFPGRGRQRSPGRGWAASASRTRDDPSHGVEEPRGLHRSQRQRQGASAAASDMKAEEPPVRPTGKPPRAPPRSGDSPAARRYSGASDANRVYSSGGGGSIAESFEWEDEGCDDKGNAAEVGTEAAVEVDSEESVDGRWTSSSGLQEVEASVWEDGLSSREWDGEEDAEDSEERGVKPRLMNARHGHSSRRSSTCFNHPRQERHRVTGPRGGHEVVCEQKGHDEWGTAPAIPVVVTKREAKNLEDSNRGACDGRGRPLGEQADDGKWPADFDHDAAGREDTFVPERLIQQRQIGQVEHGGEWVDGSSRKQAKERMRSSRRDSFEPTSVDALGTGGVREEKHVVTDDIDDQGSYNSRWSLSAEDEAQVLDGDENGFPVRGSYGDGRASGEVDMGGQPALPGISERTRNQDGGSSVVNGSGGSVVDGSAGVVPEYLDDFFDGSDRQGQDIDVPFGVSSPSEHELEVFRPFEAATDETSHVPQQVNRGDRSAPYQFRGEGTTAGNEWLISESPGRARQRRSSGGKLDTDHALLQPVLPTGLRYSSEDAAEEQRPKNEGDSRELVEEPYNSATVEGMAVNRDDGPSKGGAARTNSEQRSANPVSHDTQISSQTSESDKSGTDVQRDYGLAPLRMDTSALFASLSSSTGAASLSSTNMAKIGREGGNPSEEVALAGQGEASSSSIARATATGDARAAAACRPNSSVAVRCSAPLAENRPPGSEHRPRVDVEDDSVARDSETLKPGESSSIVPVEDAGGSSSLEAGRRRTSPCPLDEKESTSSPGIDRDGGTVGDEHDASGSASPALAYTPHQQAEAAECSTDDVAGESLEQQEQVSRRQRPNLGIEAETTISARSEQFSADRCEYRLSGRSSSSATAAGSDTTKSARTSTQNSVKDRSVNSFGRASKERENSGRPAESHVDEREIEVADEAERAADFSASDIEGNGADARGGGSPVGGDSSRSGSVLEVGGGGVDQLGDESDDDGYF